MKAISFTAITSLLFLLACNEASHSGDAPEVVHHGALHTVMQGDLSPQADLRDFADLPHWYALGALSGLRGEILVLDGEAYLAQEGPDGLTITHDFDHRATLLVHSQVTDWASVAVPEEVVSYQELERWLEEAARAHGLDVEAPFPFRLQGQAASVSWHVVIWPQGKTDHSHQSHRLSGPSGLLRDKVVEVLGFFSKHHQAVFTHHTTFMHLHVKSADAGVVGHVDDLQLGGGMTLLLPQWR